jgi:16S rRNA processing protein RimM
MSSKWVEVGKIKDAHSLKGELFVLIFSKDISWAEKLREVQLDSQVFEIERWKPYKQGLLLKLKGIENRTQAENLKGKIFSLPEELLESQTGDTIYLSEIQDFEIVNHKGERLGKIIGFSTNIAQDLLVVEKTTGGVAEIPFVEDFISDLDFDSKKLEMDLPEGIWDLQNL